MTAATLTRRTPEALCSAFGRIEDDAAPAPTTSVRPGVRKRRMALSTLERQLLRQQRALRQTLTELAARLRAGQGTAEDRARGKKLAKIELRLRAGLSGLCLLREELGRLRRAWWRRELGESGRQRYATLATLHRIELARLVGELAAGGAGTPAPWGTCTPQFAREGRRLLRTKVRWGLATSSDFLTYFDLGRALTPAAPSAPRVERRAA